MSIPVSVVIPTFNKLSRLRLTLESYALQNFNGFEVVVCDDGSTDGTAEFLSSVDLPYALKVVRGAHHGAGAARNRAVTASDGDILIFNDDDMVPAPGFIDAHVAACTSADVLGRGARWSVPIDEVNQFLNVEFNRDLYARLWQSARLTSAEDWAIDSLARDLKYPYRFLQACTSNLAVRRRSFDTVGGFNEAFGTGWGAEDTEFGYRAQELGIGIHLAEAALNIHLEHSTDSGKKFEKGLQNFRRFLALYPDRREVRALLSYVEHAVASGNAKDLFDEQSFVDRPPPSIQQPKAKAKDHESIR
ncbi:glycosyltransferase family 2 protein [Diaminobutyricibacter sp. McL0618]|uniref:glycosyltransferase family 2 protein n=1 Tax=Leifsonia sp. McL0618 TaxID=3415677 RepID=UPI003CF4F2D2